jgi:mono/diheme cytochrome c family protein
MRMRPSSVAAPLVVTVALTLGLAGSAAAEPDAAWLARMDALAAALTQLLPDVLDVKDVKDVKDAKPPGKDGVVAPLNDEEKKALEAKEERIRVNAKALAGLAHDLTKMDGKHLPDADPTVPLLARELKDALDATKVAHGEHLRDSAFLVAATCIGCHTRTDAGAPRPRLSLAPVDPKLPKWLQADVLAATRRVEPARAAYRAVVTDEAFAAAEPTLWERAVKRALVLEVRVARDPQGALSLVDTVLHTPAGEPLWPDAAGWQRSLKVWAKNPQRPSTKESLFAAS